MLPLSRHTLLHMYTPATKPYGYSNISANSFLEDILNLFIAFMARLQTQTFEWKTLNRVK